MEAEPLAQFGEADAAPVAGDFLEDRESALDRLDAAALGLLLGGRGGVGIGGGRTIGERVVLGHFVLARATELNRISPSCKQSNNAG